MARLSEYKPEYCKIAADVLARGKSKAAVCAVLDICRPTFYQWCDIYPEFNSAVSQGMQKAQAYWEDLGEQGIRGDIEKFGGSPWIFTMKNRFRDDYKDDKADDKGITNSIVEKLIDKL